MQKKSAYYRENKEKTRVSFQEFETYLNKNKDKFDSDAQSPFRHVKCQVKKALKTIVSVYARILSRNNLPKITTTENAFSLMGADFMVDNKLGFGSLSCNLAPGFRKIHKLLLQLCKAYCPS